MAGYIGTQAVSVNTTSATISDDLSVGDDALITGTLTTTAATVFNGGFVANDGSTITTADNTTQLTLASTDTDANVGPVLDLFRNVTGATNDEIGRIQFTGKNDAGTDHTYANISSNIVDATSSGNTEDGSLVFQTIVAGSVRDRLNILSDQIVINQEGRDLDFRVESEDLTNMFFINGELNNTAIGFNALPENQGAGLGILTGSGNGGVHLFREDGSFPSADESLGSFGWSGADSSGSLSTADAKITVFANENMAAGDAGTNMQFYTKADGVNQGTAPTRAMVIASTGQVRFEDGTASLPSISNSGDTNTGMYFPAADTIGFAEGGAEAARFDSSGNFLCGTTATGTGALGFRYRKDLNAISAVADGQIAAYFGTRSSDGEILRFRKDDGDVGSIATWSGNIAVGRLNCALLFDDDTNRIKPASVQSNSARDNVIDLGDPDHRFNDVWIGGGIHLGGTGAANKLDDYEEGTFTPTWAGYAPAASAGRFTKIGNQVIVHAQLTTNASADFSGVSITNLPFTAVNADGVGSGMTHGSNATFYAFVTHTKVTKNTTICVLNLVNNGAITGMEYVGRTPQVGASKTMQWTIIYQAA